MLKKSIPTYHTRAMKRSLMTKYGIVATMLFCYKELTGDDSAAVNTHTGEIDKIVKLILELEDPVVLDYGAG